MTSFRFCSPTDRLVPNVSGEFELTAPSTTHPRATSFTTIYRRDYYNLPTFILVGETWPTRPTPLSLDHSKYIIVFFFVDIFLLSMEFFWGCRKSYFIYFVIIKLMYCKFEFVDLFIINIYIYIVKRSNEKAKFCENARSNPSHSFYLPLTLI